MDAGSLVSMLSMVPLVGKKLVNTAIERCSQRHRCDTCGTVEEVVIARIVENPLALLSPLGAQRHATMVSFESATTTTTTMTTVVTSSERDGDASASPTLPTTTTTSSAAAAAACSSSSPASSSSASSSPASKKRAFDCSACVKSGAIPPGRLGPHCYTGDSTNGDKNKLMERIAKIFNAMPEVLEGHVHPETAKKIVIDDVYWVD